MTDFHSIYQQEINVLANSMRGRQMRKLRENKHPKPLYLPDMLNFIPAPEIFLILTILLFMRVARPHHRMEKKSLLRVKKSGSG
jgi:hypothetical protein